MEDEVRASQTVEASKLALRSPNKVEDFYKNTKKL